MKMLLVVIFALSCTQISNVVSASTVSKHLKPKVNYPPDDYYPDEELETCGFKYGATAAKNQFPHVAFLKSRNTHRVQYCSGSLIHARWVLTSAYCTLSDATVEVTLGALVPFDEEDPDRVVVQSEVVYVHPGYLPFYRDPKNDVALIKLSRPVTSDAIIPINLKRDSGPLSMNNITFAGWGEVGYETLTFTESIVIFEGPCRCYDADGGVGGVGGRYGNAAGDSQFFCCISGDYFCFIHNGGGLVVNGVLVAVMSTRCFPNCRHHEGIFTNVYKHLQWIDDTVNPDSIPDRKVYGACSDVPGFCSGVYIIQPNEDVEPFEAFCELSVTGDKWTVIQQRFNKSVDFYRTYANYTKGFGSLTGNHWLGLEKIHQITKDGDYELKVVLETHKLTSAYAKYSTFKVDSEGTGFQLTISGYSGNAGDSMDNTGNKPDNLNGMKFTTFDKDQDKASYNCAVNHQGAWWYNRCSWSNMNSPYYDTPVEEAWKTMSWYKSFGNIALKSARIMVRRK